MRYSARSGVRVAALTDVAAYAHELAFALALNVVSYVYTDFQGEVPRLAVLLDRGDEFQPTGSGRVDRDAENALVALAAVASAAGAVLDGAVVQIVLYAGGN